MIRITQFPVQNSLKVKNLKFYSILNRTNSRNALVRNRTIYHIYIYEAKRFEVYLPKKIVNTLKSRGNQMNSASNLY